MLRDNRSPSTESDAGNTHRNSEPCRTTCKYIPTNDRDNEQGSYFGCLLEKSHPKDVVRTRLVDGQTVRQADGHSTTRNIYLHLLNSFIEI
jgi:hypothetical protein